MRLRRIAIPVLLCLYGSTSAQQPNIAGTWILPAPWANIYPGEPTPGYPNPNAVAERYEFAWKDGALSGKFVSLTGETALTNVKSQDQAISFSQGSATFEGHITATKLKLVRRGAPPNSDAIVCRRATQQDLEILAVEPVYNLQKLPLPNLHDVSSGNLAPSPPMGIGNFPLATDAEIRKVADQMVAFGLRDAGYVYIQIDEGWQGRRDANGEIHSNANFPDMKGLADYVHAKGLKLGIYSSPGPAACWGFAGSHGHEEQDAKTFASWGVDYLKYDWCSAGVLYRTQAEMQAAYQKMGDALRSSGRTIVYSLCQYGMFNVPTWGRSTGANLWRTTGDIADNWQSMSRNGFDRNAGLQHTGADGWNDPDNLQIGKGGMSVQEYRTQMTLWSMMAAPLFVEKYHNNLDRWTPEIKSILLNGEVIAVDQDKLGTQAHRISTEGTTEIWTKPLSGRATAIAFFNRGTEPAPVHLELQNAKSVRDLWGHIDLPPSTDTLNREVPPHGSLLFRVAPAQSAVRLSPIQTGP